MHIFSGGLDKDDRSKFMDYLGWLIIKTKFIYRALRENDRKI